MKICNGNLFKTVSLKGRSYFRVDFNVTLWDFGIGCFAKEDGQQRSSMK